MKKIKILLMKVSKVIMEMLKDERGQISIKPVIAFVLSITLGVTLVINTTHPKEFQPAEAMIWGVVSIVVASIAGDTADKFSFKQLIKKKDEEVSQ
jgi:uncharacterized protein (UPF0333 family)